LERKIIYLIFCILLSGSLRSQEGCTDPQANNFNANASQNDGSCIYNQTSYSPLAVSNLTSPLLAENSGLIRLNESLWVLNDGGNEASLYELDTLGNLLREVVVQGVENNDWESLAENELYVFIGDFGNNSGTRTNLSIIKIEKQALLEADADSVLGVQMQFNYGDQVDFSGPSNGHNFDCEAFISLNDSLYLFSKNWADNAVKKYALPIDWEDIYVTLPSETYDIQGLVTGATVDKGSGNISLLAYYDFGTGIYSSFIYMLWDYSESHFFSGNKRRIDIGSMLNLGQTEGITLNSGYSGYFTSEEINSIITIPPKLFAFDFYEYFENQLVQNRETSLDLVISIFPNPIKRVLHTDHKCQYEIYDWSTGNILSSGICNDQGIDLSFLRPGFYFFRTKTQCISFLKI
jgi:hypothetical protein